MYSYDIKLSMSLFLILRITHFMKIFLFIMIVMKYIQYSNS
jgi:hypothetical protein